MAILDELLKLGAIWVGYSDNQNSWVPLSDLINIKPNNINDRKKSKQLFNLKPT